MATVIERPTKNGMTYRVQVVVADHGTGKRKIFTKSWRPPPGVPVKEANRLLEKFKVEYEELCRSEAALVSATGLAMTVADYSKIWLEYIKQNCSASYYSSANFHLKQINARLGGYKLKELNPIIVQRFSDELKKKTFTTEYAKADGFDKIMKEKGLNKMRLAALCGISDSTVRAALNGEHISVENAKKIADALECKADRIFKVIKTENPYKPASILKTIRTLRAMLGMAKRQQMVENNFASGEYIAPIKQSRQKILFFDTEQAKIFADGVMKESDMKVKTALMTILMTGFRRGELSGLEWSDIDFSKNTIAVNRSATHVAGMGVVTGKPKSSTSMREITMPPTLAALIKDYRLWWDSFTESLGDRYQGCQRLFLTDDAKPIAPSTLRFWLHKMTEKLGLPDINVHALRHTNISLQLTANVPLKTVSTRAGHSSTKLTMDTYWQFFKSSDIEAANVLDNLLKQ